MRLGEALLHGAVIVVHTSSEVHCEGTSRVRGGGAREGERDRGRERQRRRKKESVCVCVFVCACWSVCVAGH